MKTIDEQRYLWLLRAFGVLASLLIALNMVLILTFSRIAPQDKMEAFFVQTGDESRQAIYMQRAANLEVRQDSLGLRIARNMIRKYIVDRESVSLERARAETLAGPDSDVYYMSAPELYREFASGEEYRARILNPARLVASVSVKDDDVNYMSRLGTWEAKFALTTMDANGMNRKTEQKTAKIEAAFDASAMTRSGRESWRNPLGFKILKYEIAE